MSASRTRPRRRPRPFALAGLALTTLLGGAGSVAAAPPSEAKSLGSLAEHTDLAFRGVVQEIEYAMSEPAGAEQVRVPYTFVTYRVDDVLLGDEPGLTVTLRFIGGFNAARLTYLAPTNVPQFDLGDEDILFVKDNTFALSPLVGERGGRLRIIGGQVYSDTGRAITLAGDGALRRGDLHRLPEVQTTTIAGKLFSRRFGPDAVDGPGDAIAADTLVRRFHRDTAGLEPADTFEDADPLLPFPGPDMTPAPPPATELAQHADREDDSVTLERQNDDAAREASRPRRGK